MKEKESAAPVSLFVVNDNCEKLESDKADKFHSMVAKILFATKRARPDTGTSILFLTTRIKEPDREDWAKLTQLMRYLVGTRRMPLILGANGSVVLKWWVDGSYGVPPNLRGHTGGGLCLGKVFRSQL